MQGLPEGCNPTTFEGMKMFLLREYTPRNAVGSAVKSLKKIKQKPNEKVNPYYWRLVAQVERVSRAFDSEGKKDYVTTSDDDHLTKILIKGYVKRRSGSRSGRESQLPWGESAHGKGRERFFGGRE